MSRLMRLLLIGFVLIEAIQVSLAAIEIVSRGKRTAQSSTYRSGTSNKAVDGNYGNTNLGQCATLLNPRNTRSSQSYVKWEVDLGRPYAIVSVTIYNTAVVPEGALTYGMSICAIHRKYSYSNISTCVSTPSSPSSVGYVLPPGGNVTIHFNQLVVANMITIGRTGFLTLCEVDVRGTTVAVTPEENASIRRTAVQSGTVSGRSADYAVDGNTGRTDMSRCASAFSSYNPVRIPTAWWQVNLGDFYLVKSITVYFPTVQPDMLFTYRFNSFISFNDSLPSTSSYRGPGTCYYSYNYVSSSSGIKTLDCTSRSYGAMQIVGRYVTIMPVHYYPTTSVLTLCEVTVNGVRQNIAADDPAFAVFASKRDKELPETTTTPSGNYSTSETVTNVTASYAAGIDTKESAKDSAASSLSIAALVIAVVFAVLCIILIIVIIKMRGQTVNQNANPRRTNAYQNDAFKKEERQPQQELQMQEPSAPPVPVYKNTVDDDDNTYEYVGESDLRRATAGRPQPTRDKR